MGIETYVAGLGVALLPDVPLFRNKKGTPYSKDSLARAFARKVARSRLRGEHGIKKLEPPAGQSLNLKRSKR